MAKTLILNTILLLMVIELSFAYTRINPSTTDHTAVKNNTLVCYYGHAFMNESKIPPDLCTHIIFASVDVDPRGFLPRDPSHPHSWRLLANLKKKNPHLKVMVSMGSNFESVVGKEPFILQSFVNGTNKLLHEYGFDGVDLDWEFPGIFKRNEYYEFQKALYTMLHPQGKILSAAMPHDLLVFVESYYTEAVNKFFDFMTIMTYDYYTFSKTSTHTGYNSPLKPAAEVINQIKNIAGVLPHKLLLGYASYGRSWKLADPSDHGLGAKAVAVGAPGPYLKWPGIYTLPDVCLSERNGAKVVRDEENGAEYLYHGDTWVSFNGMYSAKVESEWVRSSGIGGIGVFAVEYSDWDNVCGYGTFPVFKLMKKILNQP